ncbi:triose-phosphate isomerase [Candidatus Margulisiibacteriota bacterium]
MRTSIIAGNWKMNKSLAEAEELVRVFKNKLGFIKKPEVILCPPFMSLEKVNQIIKGTELLLGAQNMHFEVSGAYTGEISAGMLQSVGCSYVILGHSERRAYFSETDDFINKKLKTAFSAGLKPIVCVGESLDDREAGRQEEIVGAQLEGSLAGISGDIRDNKNEIIIAYEPVWAIGTGKVATPEQAQEMHSFIRQKLSVMFGQELSVKIRILYGGSVKPGNVASLACQQDIDGALVGGASLDAESFEGIVKNYAEAEK